MTHLIRFVMRSQVQIETEGLRASQAVIRQFPPRSDKKVSKAHGRPKTLFCSIFKFFGDNPSVGRSQMIDGMNIQHLPVSGSYMNVRFNPSIFETPPCLLSGGVPKFETSFPVLLAIATTRHVWGIPNWGKWIALAKPGRLTMFITDGRSHPREFQIQK